VVLLCAGCNETDSIRRAYASQYQRGGPVEEDPTTTPSYYEQYTYESAKYSCRVIAGFEIPALILMFCLAITTAKSAWLLRKIEQGQPEIEMLPAGKMVVQTFEDTVVIQNAHVMNDVNSTPDLKTEQNE